VNGGSDLNAPDADFTGAHPTRGVNPANGVVLYYQLPELKKDEDIMMEIADASGRIIRTLSSKKDSAFKRWDGGPPTPATLAKAKGVNRFVWDMRHNTMAGVQGVYIEASYRGHKASPGRYRITLKQGDKSVTTDATILPNPLYTTDAATYAEYDAFMSGMERELTTMHETVNTLTDVQNQLKAVIAALPDDEKHRAAKRDADSLMTRLKAWDTDMVSRRSRAYDDVENFEQKFTAHWMFMINATESELPRVNQSSRDRRTQLEGDWTRLKARSDAMINADIPSLSRTLWELGMGAIWKVPTLRIVP
jgi:hypothetical protein